MKEPQGITVLLPKYSSRFGDPCFSGLGLETPPHSKDSCPLGSFITLDTGEKPTDLLLIKVNIT